MTFESINVVFIIVVTVSCWSVQYEMIQNKDILVFVEVVVTILLFIAIQMILIKTPYEKPDVMHY